MKNAILKYMFPLIGTAGLLFAGCTEEVDNEYTRFQYVMEMTASADEIVLNDETPDDVALTIAWTEPVDYGSDVLTTYEYQWYLQGSGLTPGSEYEDMGNFTRTYTHAELQDIMVNDFNCLTSTWGTMEFTATASFEGTSGQIILDDEASVTVRIKTYGDKQFAADRVFISGTAVGSENIELTASESNTDLYVYNGELSAGKFNFPVVYGDENNVIVPESLADTPVGDGSMGASVVGQDETGASAGWTVSETADYRVTLNFSTRSVTVMNADDILEFEKIYVDGTATDALEETALELTQTLEDENLYAWRGELSEGTLYLPLEFNGAKSNAIVPVGDSHDLSDGSAVTFGQASASGEKYWSITTAGTYRIVVNTELRTITIYSPATDLKNKTVTFKRTQGEANDNYTCEIENLWIFGANKYYGGTSNSQPLDECILTQSLANPRLFIYKGEALETDNIKFLATNHWNNEYAFGASDEAGEVTVETGVKMTPIYGGQGNNRNARFIMPAGTNYIEVYIGSEQYDESENALGKCWGFEDSYVIFDQR